MQKITTFLTYNDQAEQAARLYVSIFEDQCRVVDTVKGPDDKVLTVTFDLFGTRYVALNAGPSPDFHFSNGVSLMVLCEDQAEVDRYWAKLTEGGGSRLPLPQTYRIGSGTYTMKVRGSTDLWWCVEACRWTSCLWSTTLVAPCERGDEQPERR